MERAFSFGRALDLLKKGHMVGRIGWNGKGQWIGLQKPDDNSKMDYRCVVVYDRYVF